MSDPEPILPNTFNTELTITYENYQADADDDTQPGKQAGERGGLHTRTFHPLVTPPRRPNPL